MKNNIVYLTCGALLFSAGCNQIPPGAYKNRGGPDKLVSVSSERVNVSLDSKSSVGEIKNWVEQDQPSRAEIFCLTSSKICKEAKNVLKRFGIPTEQSSVPENKVVLIYERVAARDCEHRYITNHTNPYNFNHPTFGCATDVNMVQMISDRSQITNPAMLDLRSAEEAIKSIRDDE